MTPAPPAPAAVARQRLLAVLAVVPILATVYQTIVLTDLTGDVVRKGIETDSYQMIWTSLAWGVATLYGIFGGLWAMPRYGLRLTLCVGLALFALGNLLCGASVDVISLSAAKVVEGLGKGATIIVCRSLIYRQFDGALALAIGFYGVTAYATRHATPLATTYVNDLLSWRWIFWINVPIGLMAIPLVRRFIRPDRPPVPRLLKIDWIAVTLLAASVSCLLFTFAWYRKWGGWSANAFVLLAFLSVALPTSLIAWVGSGLSPDEHLKRLVRVRTYVLAMGLRTLLLLNYSAVVAILAKYLTELRDYPRDVAGWVLAPAALTMAASTILTTYYRRRALRHVWLLVGVVGVFACIWRLSSIDNFTPKEEITAVVALWGFFLGLLPPVFLTDEVEAIEPRDGLYAGAVSIAFLVTALLTVPTMTSTIISAWTDRAVDSQRLNLRAERVSVQDAQAVIADYYRQRGVSGPDLSALTGAELGASVKLESVARGIQMGLRFVSLLMLGVGLLITVLLIIWPPRQHLIPDAHI